MKLRREFAHDLLRSLLLCCLLLPGYAASTTHESDALVDGQVVVTGSVSLANLISLWIDGFSEQNPGVPITVADPGSVVGIESLMNGSANIVLSSVPLSQKQIEQFEDCFGYAPTLIPVAMDAVAVYVNSLNPLQNITLEQLDAIYSANLLCGAKQPLRTWGDLGVKGKLGKQSITIYGLSVDSGANQFFRRIALCNGDYRADFQALIGPNAVEASLAATPEAIGFFSSAQQSAEIHALAIRMHTGDTAVFPATEDIQTGRYPMARTLSVIVNVPPGQKLAPAVQAFLNYARSMVGQAVAIKAGYIPLPQH